MPKHGYSYVPSSSPTFFLPVQIISVDSMPLMSATHREAVNLIVTRRKRATLEIKSTGLIPVKERRGDPVTWIHVRIPTKIPYRPSVLTVSLPTRSRRIPFPAA
jgi:hypothetical protein